MILALEELDDRICIIELERHDRRIRSHAHMRRYDGNVSEPTADEPVLLNRLVELHVRTRSIRA